MKWLARRGLLARNERPELWWLETTFAPIVATLAEGTWWFASEVLVQLSPTEVRRPDVAGWRRERMPEAPADSPVTLVPDWVCEVVSPTNASNDTITKMRIYREAKVTHYWLIDPMVETLTVYRWHPDGYLHVLGARRGERGRAEPFEALHLQVGVFFGDDEDDE